MAKSVRNSQIQHGGMACELETPGPRALGSESDSESKAEDNLNLPQPPQSFRPALRLPALRTPQAELGCTGTAPPGRSANLKSKAIPRARSTECA
eukprot:1520539-Rhodomonas_salina.1